MSTPEDQIDTSQPQSALAMLQPAEASPEGRAWGESYLRAHPQGVDTSGEAALVEPASVEEARNALRQARAKLSAQRMDPSVLGLRFAQAMLSPSKYGVPDQWSKAAGAVADWKQQNQAAQQQSSLEDVSLAGQLAGLDENTLKSRIALQELHEKLQAQTLDTALKATAKPTQPPGHYSLVEHDVTMPDGTPGKQTYMVDSSTGKVTPYGKPSATAKGAGLDARSGALFQRVLSSANEATSAINNITNLPIGASSGWFGVGASPGTSWLDSAKGVLTNKMSSEDTKAYMSMLPGLAKNLAMVESGGLQTAQSLNDVFSKLELRQGDDDGYTRLHKLAEYRQIVEKGIEPYLHNPRIPPEQKEEIQLMIDQLRASIPFTHNDVTGLSRAHQQHPEMTFGEYIASQGLANKKPSTGAAAPTAAPSTPGKTATSLPPAALAKLQEGFTTTFGNGQKWTLRNGQPVQVQ